MLGCWEIEHTDIERAVAAKCPIEMGGYDSLEQLQRVSHTCLCMMTRTALLSTTSA